MSMMRCDECEHLVDTDDDPDSLYCEGYECLCSACRLDVRRPGFPVLRGLRVPVLRVPARREAADGLGPHRQPGGTAMSRRRPHPAPIPMVLHCPECGCQHVDAPDPESDWDNPPHRSHLCARCGAIWRPADVPTVGVCEIRTRGRNDTWPPVKVQENNHG